MTLLLAALGATAYLRAHRLVFNESFLGHAHCIVLASGALNNYAQDNKGKFPTSTNGYGDALLQLLEYSAFSGALTGPGYDGAVFDRAAKTGGHVPESACGRVYVQGLSGTNDQTICILFDKIPSPGDHCHMFARLTAPTIREVAYVDGTHSVIRVSKWGEFATNQITLLIQAGFPRDRAERLYAETLR